MTRNPILQTVTLVVTGVILALVANAGASRDRKVMLIGSYPNALRVPPREAPGSVAPVSGAQTSVAPTAPTHPITATATAAIETVGLNPAAKTPKAPTSAPTAPVASEDVLKRFQPHPDKAYTEIGFADVKALHAKNVLFLDARRTSAYEQGHIPGSRTYSVWESDIDDKVRKLFDERGDPREQALPIVIYCSGGDCEDSHMLAQKLWGIQFNNVYVYKDGFPDWQQHGAPVHTGANP